MVEEDFRPDGGVRGIVVGDIFRRLVVRTIAQQISKRVEAATAPFQYVLKTKAGCECVAHVSQTLTGLDPEPTVMSIDGVGSVRSDGGRRSDLPLGAMFSRQPIHIFVGRRDGCHAEHSTRGMRGARDPLMPMLHAGCHANEIGRGRARDTLKPLNTPKRAQTVFL